MVAPRWAVLACVYVGAVVGAGFASGQEILQFFVRHGPVGLLGCILAGGLFSVAGAAALRRIIARRHAHYGALLRDVCGPRAGAVLDHLGAVALFVGLAAVVAAAGALGNVLWGWPSWWGSTGLVVVLAGSALGGRVALERLNLVAAPLIAVACLASAWTARIGPPPPSPWPAPHLQWSWVLSATLYVAYNMMLAAAGLCGGTDGEEHPRDAAVAGFAGGALLGVLCAAATVALLSVEASRNSDLPLAVVMSATVWGRVAYPCVLVLSLWTTGGAAAAALGRRTNHNRWPLVAGGMVVGSLPLALFGLRVIVVHIYPILGYCGLPLLVALLLRSLRRPDPLGNPDRAR